MTTPSIEEFLTYVENGNDQQVEECLNRDPSLVNQKNNVINNNQYGNDDNM
jgi:hypothetical protein